MSDECPTPEVLEGYLRQTLPDERSDRLRPHVIACRACQAALGRIHFDAFGRERRRRRRSARGGPRWLAAMVPWRVVAIAITAAIIAAAAEGLLRLILK